MNMKVPKFQVVNNKLRLTPFLYVVRGSSRRPALQM
jgi:hypothetical protein